MIRITLLTLLLSFQCFSQWSTSPYTRDALWAVPGFYSDIVTFPDGSSIVIGIGNGSQIWMQKLDPQGYKQWLPWVDVYPSIGGLRYFISDGDGGIYAIVSTQAQRVDKNGTLCWGEYGKAIIPSSSLIGALSDGKNGFLGMYKYSDSLQRIKVFRYDSSGNRLWEKQIDSTTALNATRGELRGRLGQNVLAKTFNEKYFLFNIEGAVTEVDSNLWKKGFFVKETDSTGFNIQNISFKSDSTGYVSEKRFMYLDKYWDTVWTSNVWHKEVLGDYLGTNDFFFPDGFGNVFRFVAYRDDLKNGYTRVTRISKEGIINDVLINGIAGRQYFSSKGRIGFVSDSLQAQVLDTSGNKLWSDTVVLIKDLSESYFETARSDNNGGAIVSFWTVYGGIKVQHTGRFGKVGVVTRIKEYSGILNNFDLQQNFPNPFNPSTTIRYSIQEPNQVKLTVFDNIGREVVQLVDERQDQGHYQVVFDASKLSSGVYFYRLQSGRSNKMRKMLLLK